MVLDLLKTLVKRTLRRTPPMLQTGTPAPDFQVGDHNGNTVSLKDFTGKRVVLWFYPKSDTPG